MRRRVPTVVLSATAGLVLFWHTGESGAQPLQDTGPDAEVTVDGLYRVHPSLMHATWVKPDVDLSLYTRIYYVPPVVQFSEIPEVSYRSHRMESGTGYPVSDLMKARLLEVFGESLYEAVSGVQSYELSNELGRDVLMVQGFLTDVISGIPPDRAGINVGAVQWAFDANIVVELRDSMSDEVLARTVDHERIDGPYDADKMWLITSQVAQAWSTLLVTRLRELSSLYPSRLRRLQELGEE